MSMISGLIDELRQMADGQTTFHDAREVMLEAADTIWELRDDLQRANDAVRDAEHDESRAWDRVRKAEAENDKLRELLQASLRDFRRIYDYDEQDGWQMVDAIDRMVIGMRKLGFDAGRTEQELRIVVN